jgi:hypothetical protein
MFVLAGFLAPGKARKELEHLLEWHAVEGDNILHSTVKGDRR